MISQIKTTEPHTELKSGPAVKRFDNPVSKKSKTPAEFGKMKSNLVHSVERINEAGIHTSISPEKNTKFVRNTVANSKKKFQLNPSSLSQIDSVNNLKRPSTQESGCQTGSFDDFQIFSFIIKNLQSKFPEIN